MDDHDEDKRTEQNLTVRSGKSQGEVTNNRRLRSTYCTIEANYSNYWQAWSIARPLCDSRATCLYPIRRYNVQTVFHNISDKIYDIYLSQMSFDVLLWTDLGFVEAISVHLMLDGASNGVCNSAVDIDWVCSAWCQILAASTTHQTINLIHIGSLH